MQKNESLVREIEEALGIMEEHQARLHTEKEAHGWETHVKQAITHAEGAIILSTLQRAREALSWIPVDRLPERDGYYLVTYKNLAPAEICDYEVKHGFNCPSYNPVIAWKQCPHAYTPEEK